MLCPPRAGLSRATNLRTPLSPVLSSSIIVFLMACDSICTGSVSSCARAVVAEGLGVLPPRPLGRGLFIRGVGLAHALRDSSVDEVKILDAHPTELRLDLFNATSDQAVVNPLDHRALSFRGSPA